MLFVKRHTKGNNKKPSYQEARKRKAYNYM